MKHIKEYNTFKTSVVDIIKKESGIKVKNKSSLMDMICWYEENYGDIENEDDVLKQLSDFYKV